MKKTLLLQLAFVIFGLGIIFYLFTRPKFTVEDHNLSDVPQEQSHDVEKEPEMHSVADQKIIDHAKKVTAVYNTISNTKEKLIFADSLGELYFNAFEYDSAAKYFDIVVSLNDKDVNLYKAGLANYEAFKSQQVQALRHDYAMRAKSYFDNYLAEHPNAEDVMVKKAVLMVNTETPPMGGINLLREIIRKNPSNAEALESLGEFQFTIQKYEKAIVQFSQVVALDEDNDKALMYLIWSYKALGDVENAKLCLNKIQKLDIQDLYMKSLIEKEAATLN